MSRFAYLSAVLFALGCSLIIDPEPSGIGTDGGGIDSGRTDVTGSDVTGSDGGADGGVDVPLVCTSDCDDDIACTDDGCVAGMCQSVAVDGRCEGGERCQVGVGCVPVRCTDDRECDDLLPCNGVESCEGDEGDPMTGCAAGVPIECDDEATCTTDSCSDEVGGCVFAPNDDLCADDIDCTLNTCEPTDSADPSGCATDEVDEMCDSPCVTGARCDEDFGCRGGDPRDCSDGDPCTVDSCDPVTMCVNLETDADGDGAPPLRLGGRECLGGTDCNDNNPSVYPGAPELCNGRDDNCDGTRDEGCTVIPNSCETAQAIPISVGGTASVTGSFFDFTNREAANCGSAGGADAVYYIDVSEVVDVEIDTIGSTADTVLAVGVSCGDFGWLLGCNDDIDRTVVLDSRIWFHRIGPGTSPTRRIYILVDSLSSSSTGDFTLNVRVTRPAPDTCAGPLDISGGGTVVGVINPTGAASLPISGSCDSAFGDREGIATFTPASDSSANFTVFTGSSFRPSLYVRDSPCGTGTELACDRGGTGGSGVYTYLAEVSTDVDGGESYYVFVDGASAGNSYFLTYDP